jgi:PKD repeat protein
VCRGLACAVALLIVAPAATGAAPLVAIQATPAAGPAPLHVAFIATGEATSYHWDFGDGTSADGTNRADHTYAAGHWTAILTTRSADGETATQTTSVTAYGLTLAGPSPARYGRRVAFRGALVPAEQGLYVALVGPHGKIAGARTHADGRYAIAARVRLPGDYVATSARAESAPLALRVVPKLVAGLAGSGARDSRYFFNARLVPVSAGALAVKITRGQSVLVDRTFAGRVQIKLDTRRLTSYRIRAEVLPVEGYAGTVRVLRANVVLPLSHSSAASSSVYITRRPPGRASTVGCSTPSTPSRRFTACRAPGSSMPGSGMHSRIRVSQYLGSGNPRATSR